MTDVGSLRYNFDVIESYVFLGGGRVQFFGPFPKESACLVLARKRSAGALRDEVFVLIDGLTGWIYEHELIA